MKREHERARERESERASSLRQGEQMLLGSIPSPGGPQGRHHCQHSWITRQDCSNRSASRGAQYCLVYSFLIQFSINCKDNPCCCKTYHFKNIKYKKTRSHLTTWARFWGSLTTANRTGKTPFILSTKKWAQRKLTGYTANTKPCYLPYCYLK